MFPSVHGPCDPPNCIIGTPTNRKKFVIPSVYTTRGPALIASRKLIKPTQFINSVLEGVKQPKRPATRNLRLTYVAEGRQIKHIRFNSLELSILYSMFLRLTKEELRPLTIEEFENFCYGSLLMTNKFLLAGLIRGAAWICETEGLPQIKGIGHHTFVRLLSILLRGSFEDRANLAFCVMDIDDDGLLRKSVEYKLLLKDSFRKEFNQEEDDIYFDEALRETVRFLASKTMADRGYALNRETFVVLCYEEPWLLESLLPCRLGDLENISFQSIFCAKTILPMSSYHELHHKSLIARNEKREI